MTQLDDRVREAFLSIDVPEDVKTETMEAIARMVRNAGEAAVGDNACSPDARLGQAAASDLGNGGCKDVSQNEGRQDSVCVAAVKRTAARSKPRRRFAFALAACLTIAAVGGGGAFAYASETASVSIDSQSSKSASTIVLGVNRFNIVVSAEAEDGAVQQSLDDLGLCGMTYDDAFSMLLAHIDDQAEDIALDVSVESNANGQGGALRERTMACMHDGGISAVCEDGVCKGRKGEGAMRANDVRGPYAGQGQGAADGACAAGDACEERSCEEHGEGRRGQGHGEGQGW